MTDVEFSNILKSINDGRTVTVPLSLNIRQLEIILDTATRLNFLRNVAFSGYFNTEQKTVVTNLYIVAIYDNNDVARDYFEELARSFSINLQRDFNFRVNQARHHLELHGFNAANVRSSTSRQAIARFKLHTIDILIDALKSGNVNLMLHAYYYLEANNKRVNLNIPMQGKLAIEWACEKDNDLMVETLLVTCKVDLFAKNFSKRDAIDIICRTDLTKVLLCIVRKGFLVPSKFNSPNDQDYDAQKDIYKRIVDANSSGLMIALLKDQYTTQGVFLPDLNLIKRLFIYARDNRRPYVAGALQRTYEQAIAREKTLLTAIEKNDINIFNECLRQNIDINCTVDGIQPIQLIIKLGRKEMLTPLLQSGSQLIWYEFQATHVPSYKREQDIVYQAIVADQVEILFHFYDLIGQKIDEHTVETLESMLLVAQQSSSPNILAHIAEIHVKKYAARVELMQLAINEEYNKLLDAIENSTGIDFLLDGESVLHILCRKNASAVVQVLLSRGHNINIMNSAGEYPITIAARNGNNYLVTQFLGCRELRVSSFATISAVGYEANLDIAMIAIDRDDTELLTTLLLDTSTTQRFGELNIVNLKNMLAYANEQGKTATIALLTNYVHLLQRGRPIFTNVNTDIQNYMQQTQNVSRTDRSAVSSLTALAPRYGFDLSYDPVAKRMQLSSDLHDIEEIFNRLEDMIKSVKQEDIKYPVYKLRASRNSKEPTKDDYVFSHFLDIETYKEYAKHIFSSIKEGKDGKYGCYATWRCAWNEPGAEKLVDGAGLTTKEIWALVILAALDRLCIPETWLDDEEIRKRELVLVAALVECTRTYNRNNFWDYDVNGTSSNSCVHGTAMRPLNAFSRKHPDIIMLTSPMPWALEVVADTVREYYTAHVTTELSASLLLDPEQLQGTKRVRVDSFYSEVKTVVRKKLLEEVRLLTDPRGGYLLKSELDEALISVDYVPLVNADTLEADRTAFKITDRAIVPDKIINGTDGQKLLQVKLPFTTDAFFNAILISARDKNVELPADFDTPEKMRAKLNNIFDFVFNAPERFAYTGLPPHFARLIKSRYGCVYIWIDGIEEDEEYESIEQARINGNLAKIPELRKSLAGNGAPDLIMLEMISFILSVNMNIYSFGGRLVSNVSCGSLGSKLPDGHKTLNICVACVKNGTNFQPNYFHVTPLINEATKESVLPFITRMPLRTLREQVLMDEELYTNYAPMPLRNITIEEQSMQQIKIPLNGDSALNAILSAAINTGNVIALQFVDADALRNRLHITLLADEDERMSAEDIALVGMPLSPLGLIEIAVLAEILLLKIAIKHTNHPDLTIFNESALQSICLLETDGHFNVLAPENSWHTDLTPTPRVTRSESLSI